MFKFAVANVANLVLNNFYKSTCEKKKPLYICTRFWKKDFKSRFKDIHKDLKIQKQ